MKLTLAILALITIALTACPGNYRIDSLAAGTFKLMQIL